jgi:uncharacterized NAD-dependent epimerase/dehydratase family protein
MNLLDYAEIRNQHEKLLAFNNAIKTLTKKGKHEEVLEWCATMDSELAITDVLNIGEAVQQGMNLLTPMRFAWSLDHAIKGILNKTDSKRDVLGRIQENIDNLIDGERYFLTAIPKLTI